MQEPTEEQLVRATSAGDRSAYGTLYDRYAPLVRAVCYDYTRSLADAQDLATGRHRLLLHEQKVIMMEIPSVPDGPGPFAMLGRPVENLWNLRDGTERTLGRKEIEGQPAVGFEVRQDTPEYACNIVVWAHKDSGHPVRVEMNLYNPQGRSQSATMVMDHFNLDVELDERLFSLDPPAGYTVAYEKTLEELKTLYEETERAEDLLRTEERGKAADATREAILQGIRGQ